MIEKFKSYFENLFNKNSYVQQSADNHYEEIINGAYRANKSTIDESLCVNGQANLDTNVLVQKKMLVNGRLLAKHTEFESDLTVNGSASLNNTKIGGDTYIRGNLDAQATILSKKIELLSNIVNFDKCNTTDILIKALPVKNITQRIKLINNTKVSGNIIFEGGKGEIYCDSTSTINGKITGGKLIHY